MKNNLKLRGISAALVLSMFLAGCTEQPNNSPSANPDKSSSSSETQSSNKSSKADETLTENSTADETSIENSNPDETSSDSSQADKISINDDVVWGLGKTVEELTQKYGRKTSSGDDVDYICVFENGYGRYGMDDGVCTQIVGIETEDILKGEYSVMNYEELKSRAGIDYWYIGTEPDDMYECWWAYFTHPSYPGVTFAVYSQTATDEVSSETYLQLWLKEPADVVGPSNYNG